MASRRGISIIDVVAALIVVGLLVVVFMPAIGGSRQSVGLKEATQVRALCQAFTFLDSEQRLFVPSTREKTAAGVQWHRNTTAGIYRRMMLDAVLAEPEVFVSPLESNPDIRPWLEGEVFSVGLELRISHASFAHFQPSEARVGVVSGTSSMPVVSSRFPKINDVMRRSGRSVTVRLENQSSYTLKMHGDEDSWQGNVAYADGHVSLETKWLQGGVTKTAELGAYMTEGGEVRPDLPFYDEPDDPSGTNHFLGIFTEAGRTREEFVAVYD